MTDNQNETFEIGQANVERRWLRCRRSGECSLWYTRTQHTHTESKIQTDRQRSTCLDRKPISERPSGRTGPADYHKMCGKMEKEKADEEKKVRRKHRMSRHLWEEEKNNKDNVNKKTKKLVYAYGQERRASHLHTLMHHSHSPLTPTRRAVNRKHRRRNEETNERTSERARDEEWKERALSWSKTRKKKIRFQLSRQPRWWKRRWRRRVDRKWKRHTNSEAKD